MRKERKKVSATVGVAKIAIIHYFYTSNGQSSRHKEASVVKSSIHTHTVFTIYTRII